MTKADERRSRVSEFFDWLKTTEPFESESNLINTYSFKTGIAYRTLDEYYKILESIGAINKVRVHFESTKQDGTPNLDRNGKVITYTRNKRVFNPEAMQ